MHLLMVGVEVVAVMEDVNCSLCLSIWIVSMARSEEGFEGVQYLGWDMQNLKCVLQKSLITAGDGSIATR
jgi:hypothetical protein